MSEEIILDTDPVAAKLVTIETWESRNGRHFSNEATARYDGCTHRACTVCGKPAPKAYLVCKDCRQINDENRYNAYPKMEWNGTDPLYSDSLDEFLFDEDAVRDALDIFQVENIADLRLRICKPSFISEIT